jgi:hypothetical protein
MNVEQTYKSEVVAVIPHSDEMMNLASEGIFAEHFPEHYVTSLFKQVSAKLLD